MRCGKNGRRQNHYRQGYQADNQPQAAVVSGDHHVIADHPQTITGIPTASATIACQRKRFIVATAVSLALAAFSVILIASRAVARFFHRLH